MRYLKFGLLALTLLSGRSAFGQAPDPSCAYDVCSLRMEGVRLVRGQDQRVGKIGSFSAVRLSPLVLASSDSAVAYAKVFDRDYARGVRSVTFGSILVGVGVGVGTVAEYRHTGVGLAFVGVGAAFSLWGAPKLRRGTEALARAIWWHNRGLAPSR